MGVKGTQWNEDPGGLGGVSDVGSSKWSSMTGC